MTQTQLDELAAADIAYFYLNRRGSFEDGEMVNRPVLKIVDLEGSLRTFSDEDFGD